MTASPWQLLIVLAIVLLLFGRGKIPQLMGDIAKGIKSFKKDEAVTIPLNLSYDNLSGLSNEIKSKLKEVKPKTLGQAIRIDGMTPAAIIILLSHIKKLRYKASA